MDPFETNITPTNGNYLQNPIHYLEDNTPNTDGYFDVFLNSTTNTNTSGDGTQAVNGNNVNVPFLFFTLDNFQSESSKIIAVIVLVIGGLGLVGNLCTVLKIWSDKKFHTPTFAVIGCLAFADFLSIIRSYFATFTNLLNVVYFEHGVQFLMMSGIAFETSYCSSLGHMILLSLVRYLTTVHPLQSRSHLTTLVVILWSVTVWILSLILTLCAFAYSIYNIFYTFSRQVENVSKVLETLIWNQNFVSLIQAMFPFCTILTLHCSKMKSLKSSQVRTKTKTKMNLIITVILGVFLTFQMFVIVLNSVILLKYYGILNTTFLISRSINHMNDVGILLGFLHFSCNPYIYFFISCCFRAK